jgi:hypothetical protein
MTNTSLPAQPPTSPTPRPQSTPGRVPTTSQVPAYDSSTRRNLKRQRGRVTQQLQAASRAAQVMDLFARGVTRPAAIKQVTGFSRDSIRRYLAGAFAYFAEKNRESVHEYLGVEWEKLNIREDEILKLLRRLGAYDPGKEISFDDDTGEKKKKEKPVKLDQNVTRLFDCLDKITGRRLEILRMVDPGIDESEDTDLVLVLVENRSDFRGVMDAVSFRQALTGGQPDLLPEPPHGA